MGWETFQFGRLYLNGKPQHIPGTPTSEGDIPDYKEGQGIDIMEAPKEHSITWIKPDGINLFVADRVLLKKVSWEDLETAGFVEGKTVDIGGKRYRCRLLQVGSKEGEVNEWDRVLDATAEDNGLWHWMDMYFWGKDGLKNWAAHRAYRGYHLARYWSLTSVSYRNVSLGFRPALEPLVSDVLATDKIITLDDQKFVVTQLQGAKDGMFYPQLTPIGANPFVDIPDGKTIKMYTVLVNGNPVRTDLNKSGPMPQGAAVIITDKFYGREFLIPWVLSNGVAVASRPLLEGDWIL